MGRLNRMRLVFSPPAAKSLPTQPPSHIESGPTQAQLHTEIGLCEPPQPHTEPGPGQNQELQGDLHTFDSHDIGDDFQPNKKKHRGATLCADIWTMPPGQFIQLDVNNRGQPIGQEATTFANFLGTIARKPQLLPIDAITWHRMTNERKAHAMKLALGKFKPSTRNNKFYNWVMKSLNSKWREWKCELKRKHYDTITDKTNVPAPVDPRVMPEQWHNLVTHWNSDLVKTQSAKNRSNRSFQQIHHNSGTKSYARVCAEEEKKTGKIVDRAALFHLTHKKSDAASSAVMTQLEELSTQVLASSEGSTSVASRDDIYSQVLGADKPGYVRGLGLGVTLTDLWGSSRYRFQPSKSRNANEDLTAVTQKCESLEKEVKMLKEMLMKRDAEIQVRDGSLRPQGHSSYASHAPLATPQDTTSPLNTATLPNPQHTTTPLATPQDTTTPLAAPLTNLQDTTTPITTIQDTTTRKKAKKMLRGHRKSSRLIK